MRSGWREMEIQARVPDEAQSVFGVVGTAVRWYVNNVEVSTADAHAVLLLCDSAKASTGGVHVTEKKPEKK